jgi:integrase
MKRHQTALSAIFRHAHDIKALHSNPFKGRTLRTAEISRRQKSERNIQRVGWGDNINDLFSSEVFQTPLSDIGDPLFWAPLIATFAGLRMEETLQLRLRDFATDDGIYYLSVQNELGTQSVKSANGVRKIPLHKALIDLGLIKLIDLRTSQGMNRLFPNVSRSKSKGTLSGTFSKTFGYYLVSRDIKEPGLDFHALRTDFQTRLTRAKVPSHVRKGLMGHEQADVTHKNYYRAGETMQSLKEYVDRIKINYSGILPPFGRAATQKATALRVVG